MRRLTLTSILTIALLAAVGSASAQAATKVTSLRPWKKDNLYLVTEDLDGRTKPQSDPRAKTNVVRKGEWVRIKCQTAGKFAYGSNLWDKVRGYYVPDRFIKTYTDGRIQGAPTCKKKAGDPNPSGPPPSPGPPPIGTTLPDPQNPDGWSTYRQEYDLTKRFRSWSYREMSRELVRHFDRYFPFDGCGRTITLGETCRLKAPGPDGPVRVIAIAENGIALYSLDGHPEGANRTITFRWARYCSQITDWQFCDRTYLRVDAWGPSSYASLLGPFNAETVAKHYWTNFGENIREDYPRCPPGRHWVKKNKACSGWAPGGGGVPV